MYLHRAIPTFLNLVFLLKQNAAILRFPQLKKEEEKKKKKKAALVSHNSEII